MALVPLERAIQVCVSFPNYLEDMYKRCQRWQLEKMSSCYVGSEIKSISVI